MKKGDASQKREAKIVARIKSGATKRSQFKRQKDLELIHDLTHDITRRLDIGTRKFKDLTYVERVMLSICGYNIDISPPTSES